MALPVTDLEGMLAARSRTPCPWPELVPSAVLVPLLPCGGGFELLLTRRPDGLAFHAGQICFPGGRRDPDDADLLATALRELDEELAIPATAVRVVGELDPTRTPAHAITPYVGVLEGACTWRPHPDEVAEVLRYPVAAFRDPARLEVRERELGGVKYPVYYFSMDDGVTVWGATARILKQLLDLVPQLR